MHQSIAKKKGCKEKSLMTFFTLNCVQILYFLFRYSDCVGLQSELTVSKCTAINAAKN